MSKLVNWEWDVVERSIESNNDIEDLFVEKKRKHAAPIDYTAPPIDPVHVLTRDDILQLSLQSDLKASMDAFDF